MLPDCRSFHLYFGTLATLTREFPWLRYPPGGEPIGFCLLHLSLVSLFLPPLFYIFLSLSLCPFSQFTVISVRDLFLLPGPVDWSASRMQLWRQKRTRRERAAVKLIALMVAYCTHRPILATIGHYALYTFDVLLDRKFPLWTNIKKKILPSNSSKIIVIIIKLHLYTSLA